MSDIVLYEARGRIGLITLNRPEARNAVNGDVAAGLEAAIDQLEDDPSVWVGILTANTEGQERPVFCAGADLKAINAGQAGSLNTQRGGFAGFVYRERTQARDRRRRRSGDGRRMRDRARRRSGRGHHPLGVRARRGQAQPDRRRRRIVPPPTRHRPRPRRWR